MFIDQDYCLIIVCLFIWDYPLFVQSSHYLNKNDSDMTNIKYESSPRVNIDFLSIHLSKNRTSDPPYNSLGDWN